jgi:hypothetical protein
MASVVTAVPQPPSAEALSGLTARLRAGFDPSLLAAAYRSGWSAANPSYGFCSVASEVAWFMLGGAKAGWVAWNARDDDDSTHWWLRHASGQIYDPTRDQYTRVGKLPPYERGLPGRPGGFMGIRVDLQSPWPGQRRPGLRAQRLMARLGVTPGELFPPACPAPATRPGAR